MSPSRWINTTNEPKMIKSESDILKIKKTIEKEDINGR